MRKAWSFTWGFVKRISSDDIFGLSAQLAYYFLLALFPTIIFLVTLLGFLPITETQFLTFINRIAPEAAIPILQSILYDVITRPNIGVLSFGFFTAIWSASNGVYAILLALSRAYRVEVDRSYVRRKLLAIGLTIGIITAFLITLLLPVFGKQILSQVFAVFGYHKEIPVLVALIRWITPIIMLVFLFTVLFWIGPNLKMNCRKALPGALFTSFGWIGSSLAFSFYVSNFSDYSVTYGSIGGTITLMLWFYMTALFILFGGELNAYLSERTTSCPTSFPEH